MSPRKRSSEPNEFGGDWSLRKLQCVEDYLRSYLKVFLNNAWANLWYIDAFSGDGVQRLPRAEHSVLGLGTILGTDEQFNELIEGSALRALRLTADNEASGKRGFDHFAFLEIDERKLSTLKEKVSQSYPALLDRCLFICGDVNETLPLLLSRIDWSKGRAVTFIDPFATQFRWRAMEAFKGTCSDVWLLFPVGGILRMMPRSKPPEKELAASLDSIFGDGSWRKAYHMPDVIQPNLFGGIDVELQREPGTDGLLRYYKERLGSVFCGVLDPVELRTGKNAPLFALYSLVANDSERAKRASQRIAQHLLDGLRKEKRR